VAGLRNVLGAAGLDLPRVRADITPLARDLPSLQMALGARFSAISDDTATAPNVVGLLEGTDPELKEEYIVITAHMDHVGVSGGEPDSIHNGATDNASGTAGLLALAKAFSQPGARPRRSIIFVATSGGAKPGFWGSTAFVDGLFWADPLGLVSDGKKPQLQIVAHMNLDMIGGTARDSVTVDGLSTIDLKAPPTWVAAVHAELQLTVVNGGPVFSPRYDQFPFTSGPATVPSLNFRSGSHGNDRAEADSVTTVNAEQAARIVRLVFHVGQEIGNADRPPRWNAEGRRQLANGGTP
jgi:Zn-dependent M28 family amino/carboxypeptidase